jgi:hypothetical protein
MVLLLYILLVIQVGYRRNREEREERDKKILQEYGQVQWQPETKGGSNRSNGVHGE